METQETRNDEPRKAKKKACGWCGSVRNRPKHNLLYCDDHCKAMHQLYLDQYEAPPYRKGK